MYRIFLKLLLSKKKVSAETRDNGEQRTDLAWLKHSPLATRLSLISIFMVLPRSLLFASVCLPLVAIVLFQHHFICMFQDGTVLRLAPRNYAVVQNDTLDLEFG